MVVSTDPGVFRSMLAIGVATVFLLGDISPNARGFLAAGDVALVAEAGGAAASTCDICASVFEAWGSGIACSIEMLGAGVACR